MKLFNSITAVAAACLFAGSASASIMYGNLAGDSVMFANVEQDNNGVFGSPIVSGDSLVFTPVDFQVQAEDGSVELLDGTIGFALYGKDGNSLDQVIIEESGFWSLIAPGGGTDATSVAAAVAGTIQFLEVGGSAIGYATSQAQFTEILAQADFAGAGTNILTGWNGTVELDIEALALAAGLTAADAQNVTGAAVVIDNQLIATSEDGTIAFIDKKGADVTITVPEPATAALLGTLGLIALRRRSA